MGGGGGGREDLEEDVDDDSDDDEDDVFYYSTYFYSMPILIAITHNLIIIVSLQLSSQSLTFHQSTTITSSPF